jgi:CRISPR-associated endoribonuclease Cas6
MRIHLKTTSNTKPVPFDHLPSLVGSLHKWIGKNEIHDSMSLYSFSWLKGGKSNDKGLNFRYGSNFFISAYQEDLLKSIIKGILKDPEISFGLKVIDITIQQDPEFSTKERFLTASPVLVKRKQGDRERHYLFNEEGVDDLLTETLRTKLKFAGLEDSTLQIQFDRNYRSAKGKKVNYKGIGNMANVCPVIIKGKPETIAFAWNVGLGNSTGIGLGTLIECL